MDKSQIIEIIALVLMMALGVYALKVKDKSILKKFLLNFVYSMMLEAQIALVSKEGKEKLRLVLDMYDKRVAELPIVSKLFIKTFLSRDKVEKHILELMPRLKEVIEPLQKANQLSVKNIAKKVKDEIIESALTSKLDGDINLINNSQLFDISNDFDTKLENRGYIKGFANIKSNLKDEHDFRAGLEAIYTF